MTPTLIIGSSGAIGSALKSFHTHREEDVTTISRAGADYNLDLRSDNQLMAVARQFESENRVFRRIYVASGVIGEINSIADVSLESFRDCFEVNLMVPVKIIKWFSRFMICDGSMVFLSGGGAAGPMSYFTPYASSKAALVRLVETSAREKGLCHIRLYAVGPGQFKSQMLHKMNETATSFLSEQEVSGVQQVLMDSPSHQDEKIRKLVHLCDSLDSLAIEKVSGRFYSSTWDDVSDLVENIDANPDSYTLRRIDSTYISSRCV